MGTAERALGRLVAANNVLVRRSDPATGGPIPTGDAAWHSALTDGWPVVRKEWDAFVAAGGDLPLIEDLIDEHQGNEGPWRAGLLVNRGRACPPLSDRFPATLGLLATVPGLRSALWSELEPGTELPEHEGPNAGVLRFHLGVRCGSDAALRVGDQVVPYRDGEAVLFDDTVAHSAWNAGSEPRVTLFCEIDRTLPPVTAALNRMVQGIISLDPRYRHARARSAEWDLALNPALPATVQE